MKQFPIYILLLVISCLQAYSNDFEFDITSLTNEYYGSVNFLDKTIIYSNNSTILWSSDKGQTWNKKQIIDEPISILDMQQCDSLLVGLMYKKYLVKSKDGINWEKIPLDSNQAFISFDYYNGKYYVLTYKSIQVYSGQTLLDSIPMPCTYVTSDLVVNSKRIMLRSGYYSIVSWDTKTLSYLDSINVTASKYNNGIQFLKNVDNKLYCLCNKTLYRSSDLGDSWAAVADSLMNYAIYNDDIYRIWASYDKYFNNQTTFRFDKLGADSKWNNLSVTKYDRMAPDLYFQNIIFIDSLHIAMTGVSSHLSVSSDGGKSWELKSLLSTNGKAKWFNPDTGVCLAGKAIVYRTTNGGITWLPNKITDSYIKYFAENKFGTNSTAYLDLDSSGLVFATYPIEDYLGTKVNILKSTDFGDSFEAIIDTNLNAYYSLFNYPVKWNGNRTIAFKDSDFSYNIATFDSNLNSLWTNTNIQKEIYGLFYFSGKHYVVASELLTELSGIDSVTNEKFSLMESSDTCKTWQETAKLFGIPRKEGYFTPSISSNLFNGHLIILAQEHIAPIGKPDLNEWTVHEYNMPNGEKLNECVIDSNYNFTNYPFVTFNNYNILFGHSLILYHKVSDPFCQWETMPWTKSSQFIYHSTIGNYLYGLLNSSLVKMTLTSLVSAIEDQEKINAKGAYLYVYPPYPLPSNNKVKISIYHDMSAPIESAKINVYNCNGDKVAGRESITFVEVGQTHSIIEWRCQGMPLGVYLICINHNNTMKTVKAIVK